MESGTDEDLRAAYGCMAQSGVVASAVGADGAVLHRDGDHWTHLGIGVMRTFAGVWGASGNDIFVAGDRETILHDGPVE